MPDTPSVSKRMGIRAFARSIGVNQRAIQRAIADGRITSVERTKRGWRITDAAAARAELEANTRPRARDAGQVEAQKPDPTTLSAATLRERLARAKLIELDYERKRRTLIPLRDAEMSWSALVVAARTRLLGVPSRAKQRLPSLSAADVAVLDELIREALDELANESAE